MDRRQALKHTAAIFGGSLVGAQAFLSGCTSDRPTEELFSAKDLLLMDEIGETILPETEQSPGAKAARIGAFMSVIVTDCYSESEQAVFKVGLETIDRSAEERFSKEFLVLSPAERYDLLATFDQIARSRQEGQPVHFFTMLKQLVIWGYFTSEPGVTKALRYNPVPGRFEGCVPYQEGESAWF